MEQNSVLGPKGARYSAIGVPIESNVASRFWTQEQCMKLEQLTSLEHTSGFNIEASFGVSCRSLSSVSQSSLEMEYLGNEIAILAVGDRGIGGPAFSTVSTT